MKKTRIILASASPRRKALLASLGIPFENLPADICEEYQEGLPPRTFVEKMAEKKALQVGKGISRGLIIAADTVASFQGRAIGKPKDPQDAVEILKLLSGTSHEVITGLCLLEKPSGRKKVASAVTRVTMKRIPEDEIREYVRSGEATGKAGAYAIQDKGDRFVETVEGSFSNVVGLPLELLCAMIREMRIPGLPEEFLHIPEPKSLKE